jgi:hypothetical protein
MYVKAAYSCHRGGGLFLSHAGVFTLSRSLKLEYGLEEEDGGGDTLLGAREPPRVPSKRWAKPPTVTAGVVNSCPGTSGLGSATACISTLLRNAGSPTVGGITNGGGGGGGCEFFAAGVAAAIAAAIAAGGGGGGAAVAGVAAVATRDGGGSSSGLTSTRRRCSRKACDMLSVTLGRRTVEP